MFSIPCKSSHTTASQLVLPFAFVCFRWSIVITFLHGRKVAYPNSGKLKGAEPELQPVSLGVKSSSITIAQQLRRLRCLITERGSFLTCLLLWRMTRELSKDTLYIKTCGRLRNILRWRSREGIYKFESWKYLSYTEC